MTKLKIGKDGFSLPLELVTSTQAILARKRSGKSYTASVEAEELLAAKQQIAVIDPTSAWFGLRSSADGQGAGYSVVVFGGSHADAPLDYQAGKAMAAAVVEHGFSAIFDIGDMHTEQQQWFVRDFCSELLRLNRNAMHLFMDEADTYAPQQPFSKLSKECLGTVSRLVKQGGIRGVGFTMITQRPASINKDVLSQVDVLTVLRMSHPLDIKAATDWLMSETSKSFSDEVRVALPSLPVGTAFVASASMDIAKRVEVRKRTTFNSGATPKPGERKVEPKVLAKIDIEKLGKEISASVQRVREDSPEFLKKRIAELEKSKPVDPERERMLLEQINELSSQVDGLKKVSGAYDKALYAIYSEAATMQDAAGKIKAAIDELRLNPPTVAPSAAFVPKERTIAAPVVRDGGKVRAGAERMLAAVAQWYPKGRTEAQVASQVQMKRTGGTWGAYKSDLRTNGYIDIRDGLWFATDAGVEYFGGSIPDAPRSTDEVVALWTPKLRAGAVKMLTELIRHKGRQISREQLGGAVEMEPRGGTFVAYLSDLKTAGLIEVEGSMLRANAETLFL